MKYKKGKTITGADGVNGEIIGYEKPYYIISWCDSLHLDKIHKDNIENYILKYSQISL